MKTVLITGGSGKVGLQLLKHFLKKGFLVVTTTRNRNKFLKNKIEDLPSEYLENLNIIEVDFSLENAIETIMAFIDKQKIEIDSVVHNARSLDYLKIEQDHSVSKKNFLGEFDMDVVFPYHLSLRLEKDGSLKNIIFISSMYGVVAPTPNLYEKFHESSPIHYGVCKAAQIHLTKELAVRLAPETRVNCVSFGGIKGRTNEGFLKRYEKLTPQKRMLEEEDVIGPVDFLLSKNSESMTGQNLIIDGGWSIW
ncbi:SDR family oxidoreductase [Autumnicola edwardsiae]|uniref:SDR family oxidoreductase n=1 Tax=Autumnicola edwardsiae TaxID=3075594 RepID=A0ABU3CTG1_9FLAO|nr:SDR family oxidoreductase [Zunongwangia sp. F297]MDT0649649.1 SDR family oxidoreductase [Zunongwangia sp. F297]